MLIYLSLVVTPKKSSLESICSLKLTHPLMHPGMNCITSLITGCSDSGMMLLYHWFADLPRWFLYHVLVLFVLSTTYKKHEVTYYYYYTADG